MANKFKKGDQVIVITGSSKGKVGKIINIKEDKVSIDNIATVKKHFKPTNEKPGKVDKIHNYIHISNISHVENDKPVKIYFGIKEGEAKKTFRKVRFSRKSNKEI